MTRVTNKEMQTATTGLLERMTAAVDDLRRDCAEAYQVVGVLAEMAGVYDDPGVVKAMDNLSAAANGAPREHDDLLPFAPVHPFHP